MIGTQGTPLSADEHVRRVRAWVAEEPISRAVIDAVWQAEHGTRYAPRVETYRAAVRLVVAHLRDAGDVPRPVWWDSVAAELDDVTPIGARLVDALMFHVGHLSADEELRWGVITDPDSVSYGYPYVEPHRHLSVGGIPEAVARVVAGRVGLSALEKPLRRAGADEAPGSGEPLRDDELPGTRSRASRWSGLLGGGARRGGGAVRTWDIDVPQPLADPPAVRGSVRAPMTVEELVTGVRRSDRPDYTHVVWLHELAELEWGRERLGAYEQRLADEPGIEAVFHEDREPMYVLTRTLTAEQVLAAARRVAR